MAVLEAFGPEIWLAAGPTVTAAAGFHYPTRMAVIRLSGAKLFVWSPVALSDELRTEVEALGEVAHLVAPNSMHDSFLEEWRSAYPRARMHAAPGLAGRRKDLQFDKELGDEPPADWAGQVDQVVVRGNLITTEAVFFHRASGTAIFTDLIQQLPPTWFKGWRALIARWDLMTAAEPEVPRKFRNAFVHRKTARAAVQRILDWPTERVLMAHAPPFEGDGQAFIRRAFRWLLG